MERWAAKVISLFVIFFIVFGATLLPIKVYGIFARHGARGVHLVSCLVCFGGGVFLGVYMLHMAPDVRNIFDEVLMHPRRMSYPVADCVMVAGFFMMVFFQSLIKHIRDMKSGDDGEDDDEDDDDNVEQDGRTGSAIEGGNVMNKSKNNDLDTTYYSHGYYGFETVGVNKKRNGLLARTMSAPAPSRTFSVTTPTTPSSLQPLPLDRRDSVFGYELRDGVCRVLKARAEGAEQPLNLEEVTERAEAALATNESMQIGGEGWGGGADGHIAERGEVLGERKGGGKVGVGGAEAGGGTGGAGESGGGGGRGGTAGRGGKGRLLGSKGKRGSVGRRSVDKFQKMTKTTTAGREYTHIELALERLEELSDQRTAHINMTRSMSLLFALSLHNIFEGLSIGLKQTVSSVWNLSIAIVAHEVVISFSLGMQMVKAYRSVRKVVLAAAMCSSMIPVGMVIGLCISEAGELDHSVVALTINGVLQGLSTGVFIYVTFFEILRGELGHGKAGIDKMFFMLAGFVVLALLALVPDDKGAAWTHYHEHEHEVVALGEGADRKGTEGGLTTSYYALNELTDDYSNCSGCFVHI